MPNKLPSWPRPAPLILLTLALLLAVACLTPPGRLGLRFFGLGIKNGEADSRSGITYATDDVGLRLFRNSTDWAPGDQELVRLVFAASPPASRRYASLFQLGYRCGSVGSLFWLVLVLIAVLLSTLLFLRNRRERAKRTSL